MKIEVRHDIKNEKIRRILRLVGALVLVVGLAFMGYTWWFVSHSVATTGKVTAEEDRESTTSDGNKETLYYASFSYQDASGKAYTATAGNGEKTASYAVGDAVPVRYTKSNPADAKIATFGQLWLVPLVVFLVGLGIWAGGKFLRGKDEPAGA